MILLLTIALYSCSVNQENPPDNDNSSETNKTLYPKDLIGNDDKLVPFKSGIYTNEYFGFQLTFPESWDNHYIVYEHDESVMICFTGENEDSKTTNQWGDPPGLPFFFIGTELLIYSSGGSAANTEKVGTVGNTNFYFYTSTDDSVGLGISEDADEMQKRDNQIKLKMKEDIPEILSSFKAIREEPIVEKQEITLLQGGIYQNEELGFELTFPESWAGNYLIQRIDKGCIIINFYGESKWGQYYNEFSGISGLGLFQVRSESYMKELKLSSVYFRNEIGEINGEKYYLGYSIGNIDALETVTREQEIAEDEKIRTGNDYQKALEMEKDIDAILETFKPIE